MTSRAELLATLHWLTTTGHSSAFRTALGHEVWAWDLARAINLVRWGYGAQYLGRDEAWQLIAGIAPRLADRYPSWAAMAQDYLLAHDLWAGHADPKLNLVTQRLLAPANLRSPWNQMPWSVMTPSQKTPMDPLPGDMSL